MRLILVFAVALSLPAQFACGTRDKQAGIASEGRSDRLERQSAVTRGEPESINVGTASAAGIAARKTQYDAVTPAMDADRLRAQANAFERKIIRNAEITIEIGDPAAAQRKAGSIAEGHGGYVVTSEYKETPGQSGPRTTVTVVLRVAASEFNSTLEAVQNLGGRIISNKATGQDVTEEYVDLEARIRSKRALESQFLEIMKQARKVSDALEVQNQLADVRTEIERLEGRKRYLENQSSMSTITLTLQTEPPLVATSSGGFWHGLRQSFAEGLDDAAGFIAGLVHLLIVLIPVALFIFLPGYLVIRYLVRRLRSTQETPLVTTDQGSPLG